MATTASRTGGGISASGTISRLISPCRLAMTLPSASYTFVVETFSRSSACFVDRGTRWLHADASNATATRGSRRRRTLYFYCTVPEFEGIPAVSTPDEQLKRLTRNAVDVLPAGELERKLK